jgi:murein DD-endopeptidase MepM/ murein hydrolase activator NlpD
MYPTKATIPLEMLASTKKMACYPIGEMSGFKMTQSFGVNLASFYSEMGLRGHNGIDLRATTGTPALCIFDEAEVIGAWTKTTAGNYVALATNGLTIPGFEGSYRLTAYYFHLEDFVVSLGQRVKAGQKIGTTDNTGKYTTGPHLHLGLYVEKLENGKWKRIDEDNGFGGAVDPEYFFPNKEYQMLPVDYRYGQKQDFVSKTRGEIYKKIISPWLRVKLGRRPTERELNAFAYGGWDFETVKNPAFFSKWVNITKQDFLKMLGKPQGF